MVAALRAPLPENWHYDKNSGTQAHKTCVDPYDLPADTPAPRSPREAHELARAAQARGMTVEQHRFRWITASKMIEQGRPLHGAGQPVLRCWANTARASTPCWSGPTGTGSASRYQSIPYSTKLSARRITGVSSP